jgi:N,N'-diacetyllegionaminate synthase
MITGIRKIERALGDGNKRVMPSEVDNQKIARKSIVAKLEIKAGEVFTEENLTTKRPGIGISPMEWNSLVGRKSSRNYYMDELIDET